MTMYSTSNITNSSTPNVPFFGPGQGSTGSLSPILWLLCLCLIMDYFNLELSNKIFASACLDITVKTSGAAFLDDSSLSVTSN